MERLGVLGVVLVGLGVALLILAWGSGYWVLPVALMVIGLGGYFLFASYSRARRTEWKGSTRTDDSGGDFPRSSSGSSSKRSHSRDNDQDQDSDNSGGSDGGGDGGD